VPKVGSGVSRPPKDIELIAVSTVREAISAALIKPKKK
jgi:hypothetical protein